MSNEPRMGAREWMLLIVLAIVWGPSFLFIKVLVDAGIPPMTLVLGRVSIAALALLIVLYVSHRRLPASWRVWRAFLTIGALNNAIPFSLIVFGETQISSGLASIFNAMTPIFTALLAHVLTRDERLTRGKVLGIALGLAGAVVLIGPTAIRGFNLTSLAQLSSLGAAFAYGCAGIYGRRFKAFGLSPAQTAAGQLCGATIVMIPLAAFVDRPWTFTHAPTATAWLAWLGLALLCTAVAFILYFRILAVAGATNLLLVTFLVPIGALLLGALVLREHLAVSALAGMALIFSGLAAIDGRIGSFLRARRRRRAVENVRYLGDRSHR